MGLSGGTGAMYVWAQFMRTVRPESVAPLTPRQVQWRWVDFNSGRSSSGQNAGAIRIPFLSGDNVNARAYFNMEK
jgi:penicillin-binding protein 1B